MSLMKLLPHPQHMRIDVLFAPDPYRLEDRMVSAFFDSLVLLLLNIHLDKY